MFKLVAFVVLTAALAGVAALAGAAQAKGPFEVVISGGNMTAPATVPVSEVERLFSSGHGFYFPTDRKPLAAEPSVIPQFAYSVDVYHVLEDGRRERMVALMYYPGSGNESGRFRDERGSWIGIDTEFETLLDRYIASVPKALPAGGGAPSSDGTSAVWYIAPSLALGLLAIGGLAGRRLLMRRTE